MAFYGVSKRTAADAGNEGNEGRARTSGGTSSSSSRSSSGGTSSPAAPTRTASEPGSLCSDPMVRAAIAWNNKLRGKESKALGDLKCDEAASRGAMDHAKYMCKQCVHRSPSTRGRVARVSRPLPRRGRARVGQALARVRRSPMQAGAASCAVASVFT